MMSDFRVGWDHKKIGHKKVKYDLIFTFAEFSYCTMEECLFEGAFIVFFISVFHKYVSRENARA